MNELFSRLSAAQDRALRAELALPASALNPALLGHGRRPRVTGVSVTMGLSAVFALAAAVALFLVPTRGHDMTVVTGAVPVQVQSSLEARTADLPLQFSDGSVATLRSGSMGQVLTLQPHGAEVELIDGSLAAHVVHATKTRWRFRAGPFAVLVTGTRFDVTWSKASRRLTVALHEGGVTVDGAVLGAGLPLRAGQRLLVALPEGSVRVESLSKANNPAVASAPVADQPAGEPDVVVVPDSDARMPRAAREEARVEDWMTLAERGAHLEAWRQARRVGFEGLQQRLDPAGLLALADVARYAGEGAEARAVFLTLVKRFPRHHLAGDAIFSLGRLAFESGNPREATKWFARYQHDFSEGALISEATGRLLEAAVARKDAEGASSAAQSYLARSPDGPYAPLAREIMAKPAGRAGP